MKIEKKHIIVGALGVVSVALALAYWQYRKIMQFKLGFNTLRFKSISPTLFNFDLFLTLNNPANIGYDIVEQEYSIYMNDTFVSKAKNYSSNKIAPKSTSTIGVNVTFNPNTVLSVVKSNYAQMLLSPEKFRLKIDMKLKVKVLGIKVSIPYVLEMTLKEIMDMSKQPKTE